MSGALEGQRVLISAAAQHRAAAASLLAAQGALVVQADPGGSTEDDVIPLDLANDGHVAGLAGRVRERVDSLDGVVLLLDLAARPLARAGQPDGHFPAVADLSALRRALRPVLARPGALVLAAIGIDPSPRWQECAGHGAGLDGAAGGIVAELAEEGVRVNLVVSGGRSSDVALAAAAGLLGPLFGCMTGQLLQVDGPVRGYR